MSRILKEWRCMAHGIFENSTGLCPRGCSQMFVTREIRTAPAYERPNKKFVDQQLRGIAADYGVTNLQNDAKANLSALQIAQSKNNSEYKPEWVSIPHAPAGFSKSGDAAPVFEPGSMGMTPSPKATATLKSLPKPKPHIVGTYRG